MLAQLTRYWWMMLIRGLAGIAFGIMAFAWPGLTLTTLIVLFGAYAVVNGSFAIGNAIADRRRIRDWWMYCALGVLSVAAGVIAWTMPGLTALALLYVIAVWAIATGIFEIATAIRIRREIQGEWLLGLSGAASVALGILLILRPAAGALSFIWLIGAYAMFSGVMLLGLAIWLRSLGRPTRYERVHA